MAAALKPSKQEGDLMGNKRKRQRCIVRAYEWFLNLPVPIVLAAMWLTGVALISVSVVAVYLFWLALFEVAGG